MGGRSLSAGAGGGAQAGEPGGRADLGQGEREARPRTGATSLMSMSWLPWRDDVGRDPRAGHGSAEPSDRGDRRAVAAGDRGPGATGSGGRSARGALGKSPRHTARSGSGAAALSSVLPRGHRDRARGEPGMVGVVASLPSWFLRAATDGARARRTDRRGASCPASSGPRGAPVAERIETLSLLFTDIEGSTNLLKTPGSRVPDAPRRAPACARRCIRRSRRQGPATRRRRVRS